MCIVSFGCNNQHSEESGSETSVTKGPDIAAIVADDIAKERKLEEEAKQRQQLAQQPTTTGETTEVGAAADNVVADVTTHSWWQGFGPKLDVLLTPEEKKQSKVHRNLLADKTREEYAKTPAISVYLRFSKDRTSVEQAIVKIVPAHPSRALPPGEQMNSFLNGREVVRPVFIKSHNRVALDPEGHFSMVGFVLAHSPSFPALDEPQQEWLLEITNYVLKGQLTGDSLKGTLNLASDSQTRIVSEIGWEGAYFSKSDAYVAKAVKELEDKFENPEFLRLGPEEYRVQQFAKKLHLPVETIRVWSQPRGTLDRVDKFLRRDSEIGQRDRHLSSLAHVYSYANRLAQRYKELEAVRLALHDLVITAARDVLTIEQLDSWVQKVDRLPIAKIDGSIALGLALTVRLVEYGRYGNSDTAELEFLFRRFRPNLDQAMILEIAERVLAAESAEVQRISTLPNKGNTQITKLATLGAMCEKIRDALDRVESPTGSESVFLREFQDQIAVFRSMTLIVEMSDLLDLSPEETVRWAAVCLERGNLRTRSSQHRATQVISDALSQKGSSSATVAKRIAPPDGVSPEKDDGVKLRLPPPLNFGEDENEIELYHRLVGAK